MHGLSRRRKSEKSVPREDEDSWAHQCPTRSSRLRRSRPSGVPQTSSSFTWTISAMETLEQTATAPFALPTLMVRRWSGRARASASVSFDRACPRAGLAARGIRLTHHLVASPMCTPSRAALLTGRHAVRTGMAGAKIARVMPSPAVPGGIALDEVTIASMLKAKGYETGMVGKWHLGMCGPRREPLHPEHRALTLLPPSPPIWDRTGATTAPCAHAPMASTTTGGCPLPTCRRVHRGRSGSHSSIVSDLLPVAFPRTSSSPRGRRYLSPRRWPARRARFRRPRGGCSSWLSAASSSRRGGCPATSCCSTQRPACSSRTTASSSSRCSSTTSRIAPRSTRRSSSSATRTGRSSSSSAFTRWSPGPGPAPRLVLTIFPVVAGAHRALHDRGVHGRLQPRTLRGQC